MIPNLDFKYYAHCMHSVCKIFGGESLLDPIWIYLINESIYQNLLETATQSVDLEVMPSD